MTEYDITTYGDRMADAYDTWYGIPDPTKAVELLAELAEGGRALELAVGTGRIALPLRERGIEVVGIDASREMVERLRKKPGGDRIGVTIGNFRDVAVDGPFRLVFVVFNTFFALLTQEDQVACFRNVADRLTKDGLFLIEAFVPDLGRFDRDQRLAAEHVEVDRAMLSATRHDPVQQRVDAANIVVSAAGIELYPVQIRYAWPTELDLMAQLAGLRLRHRWGGWGRELFTATSGIHISVYERSRPTS